MTLRPGQIIIFSILCNVQCYRKNGAWLFVQGVIHNAVLDNSINEIMSSVLVTQQEPAFLNEFHTIFICF